MTVGNICILITIVVYMAMVVGVGVYYSRKNKSSDDFYLGGRTLGPVVTAMSAEASDMSSWLLMGLPGLAYITGLASAGWTALGLIIGTYINWLIVAKRLRQYSEATKSITLPDYFKNRFGGKSNILIATSAVFIIVFFIPYTASGFAACGKLFSSLFNISYEQSVMISAIVIAAYTMLGGFLSVCMTDLIQGIVMSVAMIIVVVFGIHSAGGWDQIRDVTANVNDYLSINRIANVNTNESSPLGIITIVSTMAWGLGYFGMPHVLLRFMAISNEKMITVSRRIATAWIVVFMSIAILIGIVGYGMTQSGAIPAFATSSDAERILVYAAKLLSEYGIGLALAAGVILSGILASTMSTADSQLLASASSFSQNLLCDVFNVRLTNKQKILAARIAIVAITIFATIIAMNPNSSVFTIVSFAWAGFGAVFGPIVLFSLFWRRTNKAGAIAGMVSGGVMVFAWKYLVRPCGGVWDIYELLPAFITSCLLIVVISLLTAPPTKEITEVYDRVNKSTKGL